jgi:ABC-type lipoprotein release transport system permease subunit
MLTSLLLIRRSLTHYWRTNLAVVAGVAAAVTVLSGALLVGESVRASLRDLVEARLGAADLAVVSPDFFRAALASDLKADAAFARDLIDVTPMVAVQGVATDQASGRRASRVQVYGVDDRFWMFHGVPNPMDGREGAATGRDVLLSPALAREIGSADGGTILLRVQRPSAIPIESLHGEKDDVGRTVRLNVRAVLPASALGEFSLQPQQGDVRAAFVPLSRLQEDLGVGEQVNTLLASVKPDAAAAAGHFENLVREHAALEDVGLRLRALEGPQVLSLEANGSLIDQARLQAAADAARELKMLALPVFTYLANTIRTRDREIPYSLITAYDLETVAPAVRAEETSLPPMVLNDWAARDLGVKTGDRVAVDYYVWEDQGRLSTRTENFLIAGVVPLSGAAADRDFAPIYPGITNSENLRDWDPPFPIDLKRVRPADEEYWRAYRTTPKAFIPDVVGQALWRSRFGDATSIRITPPKGTPLDRARDEFGERLRSALDPIALGLVVRDVRASGLDASRGATDFGEYFTYFSFFLVVSALLLAALFFKLGIEQRVREVGLLRAVGFTTSAVRRLFVAEAAVLTLAGCALGLAGAVGYGYLMMTGLRTWWVDAVGTTALTLHVGVIPLVAGAAGGALAAFGCIWWTLRSLARVSERSLLAGQIDVEAGPEGRTENAERRTTAHVERRTAKVERSGALAVVFVLLGALLLALGAAGWVGAAGAFFGAGASFLVACLSLAAFWLRRRPRTPLGGHGWWPVSRLGLRNATYRPGRSVLSMAVVASATFILISVDAFRRDASAISTDTHGGTGGFALMVDTVLPLVRDPNSPDGREMLGLSSFQDVAVTPFRVLPGDDTSCLNLYEPRQPRILGVPAAFIDEGRFAFRGSLDRDDRERANPWLLLTQDQRDEAIPVIADANSMTYVLHKGLGDDIVIDHRGRLVTLRLVAALADSVLQGELLMSEANFLKLFPEQEGYQFLFVAAPAARAGEVSAAVEDRLSDFGADATSTVDRLAEFHKVENTYLSTFQALGGLGLLLGTIGLAAVLLRNVLERRRELALLGAVGYGPSRLFAIVIAESTLLLTGGLVAGVVCALVAIAPAAAERGGRLPTGAGAWLLLFAVFGTGLVASMVAAKAAIQSRLLDALRAE